MKLLTLAKQLYFSTESEYFDYCVESYLNGQISQAKQLFKKLPKSNKHDLINYIKDNYGNDEVHNFFVNLF